MRTGTQTDKQPGKLVFALRQYFILAMLIFISAYTSHAQMVQHHNSSGSAIYNNRHVATQSWWAQAIPVITTSKVHLWSEVVLASGTHVASPLAYLNESKSARTTAPVFMCGPGNADLVVSQSGVTNPTNALGAPDGAFAELWDQNDQLVLDLTETLSPGTDYVIRWRKDPGTGGDPVILVEVSQNGSTWTNAPGSAFTLTNTSFFNQIITAGVNTRYLRFTSQNIYNVDLDAISFTQLCPELDPDVCYLVSDGDVPDKLYKFNHTTGAVTEIGPTGRTGIEAITIDTLNDIIYAADDNDFGTIDVLTGTFTPISTNMGTVDGVQGTITVNSLDGMTYDHTTGIIWASERVGDGGTPNDIVLQINPITGMPILDAFGAGVDYVEIITNEHDIDDMAIAPDGTLYAISNESGSGNQRLGIINKTNGAWTEVGDYGVEDIESLMFTATGQMLATSGKDGGTTNNLYSIDAATAVATLIGSVLPATDVEGCDCIHAVFSNMQIGDRVWDDADGDGIQDVGEVGVPNIVVNLLDTLGNPYLNEFGNPTTTVTDANGYYLFNGLPHGNYIIEFEAPAGKQFTLNKAGGDSAIDSDAQVADGRSDIVTLSNSSNNLTIDAGLVIIPPDVAFEAECAEVGSSLTEVSDATASGQSYITYTGPTDFNTPPATAAGWIRYTAIVPTNATYNIFARTWATSGDDDSWWVRVNGGAWIKYNSIPISSGWEWNQVWDADNGNTPVEFTFNAGVNTIDFAHRENGAKLDKIQISTSTTPPVGTGKTGFNCPPTFLCDSKFYQTIEVSGDYWLYELQTSPMAHIPLVNLNAAGIIDGINSTSFNKQDGYIYTINMNPPYRLYRIAGDYSVHYLGDINGFESGCFINAADIGDNGNIYIRCSDNADIYELDFSNLNSLNAVTVCNFPTQSGQINNVGDIAYNAVNDRFYGTRDESTVIVEYDLNTCTESSITASEYFPYANGAFYISADGTGYGYQNGNGNLLRIDLNTGVVDSVGTSIITSQTDGCSCEGIKFTKDVADICVSENSVVTFNFSIYNNWKTAFSGISFIDTLTDGITWASEPYGVTGGSIGATSITNQPIADFAITSVPQGTMTFSIDANIPANYSGPEPYLNQAFLSNLPPDLVVLKKSDYPGSPEIDDPTPLFIDLPVSIVGSDNLCIGEATTLAPSTGGTWSSNNPSVASVTGSGVVTALTAGTATFTFIDSSSGCQKISNPVTVNPAVPAVISGSDYACIEFPSTLTASGGVSYLWSTGDTTPSIEITPVSNTTYYVTVTGSGGCTAIASHSVEVTSCFGTVCFNGNNSVSATVNYTFTFTENPANDIITIRTTFSKNFVDNTYGVNAIGWPGGHSFNELVGSDHLWLSVLDGNLNEVLEFRMDYISSDGSAPSGYDTEGVENIAVGNINDIVDVRTSLSVNMNDYGYVLTEDSPVTNSTYDPDPNYPNWIYEMWYEADIKLSAFGSAGYGNVSITGIYASPSKTGNNTENVTEGECCEMIVDIVGDTLACDNENTTLVTNFSTIKSLKIYPSNDTYISEKESTSNYNDCNELKIKSKITEDRNSLLYFDISQIPAGSTVVGGQLILQKKSGSVTPTDVGVFRVTSDWDNTATGCNTGSVPNWNQRLSGTSWTSPGGDYFASPEDMVAVSVDGIYEWDVSNLVMDWFNGNFNNYGFLVKYISNNLNEEKKFYSLEDGDISLSPVLIIEYSSPLQASDVLINWSDGLGNTDTIQIMQPASQTYSVSVTQLGGCSGSGTIDITVDTVTAVITGNTTICPDETTTLSPTSGGIWTSSDTMVATITNDGIVTGVDQGTASFIFTKTDSGCSSDPTADITVLAKDIVSVTGPTSICEGDITNLSPTSGGTWSSSNPSVATVANDGTVTGVSNGTVTFTFTNTATGCISPPTETVTINPTPTISFTGPTAVCEAELTYLTPTSGGTWTSNNPTVATVANDGTVTTLSAGTVTFYFTDSSTNCPSENSDTLTVNAIPVVTITGASNLCKGETTTLSPSSGGTWTSSNPAVATVSNGGLVTAINPGTANFTFTSNAGCVSNATADVTVSPEVTAMIDFIGTVCLEDSTKLVAIAGGGSPGFTYNWTGPNGFTSTNDTISITDDGNYHLTITDAVGCEGVTTAFVYERYEPFIFTLNTEVCAGESLDLSVNSSSAIDYQWGPNAGNATTQGVTVTPGSPSTEYFVTVTNDLGCSSVASVEIDVLDKPVVSVTGSSPICEGSTTTLSPSSGGTWQSTNPSVATVTNNGIVTGIAAGTARFLFTDSITNCTSFPTAEIMVLSKPVISTVGPDAICEGDSTLLSPTTGGTWTSSDPSVATIDNGGLIVGISPGTATFIFTNTSTGCSSDDSEVITIHEIPPVSITGPTTICVGSTTTLSPSTGGTWVSSDPSVASVSNSGIVTGVAVGTVSFIYTNSASGCVSEATGDITVDPKTGVTITGPDSVCEGETISLSSSKGGGTWISSDPSIATINSSGVVTGISAGNVLITYDHSSQSCNADATHAIQVYATPDAVITGPTSICAGENTILSPNSGGTWISSDDNIATITNSGIVTGISAGSATFTFTNTASGCASDISAPVTVNPEVSVVIDFNGSICLNDTSQLTAIVSGGTANFAYSWTGPNGYTGNTQTIDIFDNGNYNLTVTDAAGCDVATAAFVYERYDPFIFTLNTDICEGEDVSLTVNSGTAVAYQWGPNAGNSDQSAVTVTPSPPSTTYYVTVTNDIGCTSVASATINVTPKPNVSISGSNNICAGETTTLSPSTGGTWYSTNNAVATVNDSGIVTGVGGGTVTFVYTDDATGCSSNPTLNVSVTDNTIVAITGDSDVCLDENPVYTSNYAGGTWGTSDSNIATINSGGLLTPVSSGTVQVTYTLPGQCIQNGVKSVQIYANPTVGIAGQSVICEGETTTLAPSSGGTWISSDPSIATISNNGVVTGISGGDVTFTFTSSTTSCTGQTATPVTVVENPDISLTGPGEICVNTTTNLSPTTGGIWTSSNTAIATVNSSGVVYGKSPGTASFYFTEFTNGCVSDSSITVVVNNGPLPVFTGPQTVCIGDQSSITPSADGTWTSDNPSVASITNDGIITALSPGIARFTYTHNTSGCVSTLSSPLSVNAKPTINLTGPSEICIGETTSINPTSGGTWASTNPAVATITNQGIITGLAVGTAQFIFTNSSTGCKSDSSVVITIQPPTPITLTGPDTICVGYTTTFTPSTGGTWSSSNPSVASISNTGVVTGVAGGTVTFAFNSFSGCPSGNSQPITIKPKPTIAYTGPTSLCIGSTSSLSPTSGGTWTSSNPNVATVTNGGIISAVDLGSATFTFTNTDTGCTATTQTPLTVYSQPTAVITGGNQICIGGTTSLTPTSGGTWTSSNPSIASISNSGVVSGIAAGTVTFTFTESGSNCSSPPSEPVTILPKPTVNITGSNQICVNETTTMSPTTGGTWSSTNPSVATISNNGVVTGHSQGIAKFIFTSDAGCNSNQSAPISVTGTPEVTINGPDILCLGGSTQLNPSSGGTWTSSNNAVATIDSTGLVTAISEGIVTFTFTDTATGCVSDPSDDITVHGIPDAAINGSDQICVGFTTNLTPTTGGVWTSSDPSIATVVNNGTVTAVAPGTVTFTFMETASGCLSDPTDTLLVNSKPSISYLGEQELCIGETTALSPSTGGTWTSTAPAVATITNSGIVTAVSQGTARFRFTLSWTGCASALSAPLAVNADPVTSLSGPDIICIGSTTNLWPSTGGVWTSSDTTIATVDNTGVVTGLTSGIVGFTFTESATGCTSSDALNITVADQPIAVITGSTSICIGYTSTLSPSSGGSWTSSNPAIATVSNSGIVTGKAPGKVTFQFLDFSTGCLSEPTADSLEVTACINHDFNVTTSNLTITGDLSTNDLTPAGIVYSATPILISKPDNSNPSLVINSNGTYTFTAIAPGKYKYDVSVCKDPVYSGCPKGMLEITVLEDVISKYNSVANLEFATTYTGANSSLPGRPEMIRTMANDRCVMTADCDLDTSLLTIVTPPQNGTTSMDAEGNIIYTPNPGFIGFDTLTYSICVDGFPSNCATTSQVITVKDITASNSVTASDDFIWTMINTPISGNVRNNDCDPESDEFMVSVLGSAGSPMSMPEGTYYVDDAGNYSFSPAPGFTGHAEIVYTVCDDNPEIACQDATIHILVFDDMALNIRVYLEGALMTNGGVTGSSHGRPLMRDDLRNSPYTGENYIPAADPYSFSKGLFDITPKYTHIGSGALLENRTVTDSVQVFSVTGENAIVDWVFVELRSKNDMTQPIATRSGLLQRDGDVVDMDGVSALHFPGVNLDSFYVKVKHRSHLAVMSELVPNNKLIDFTTSATEVYDFGTSHSNGYNYTGLAQNNFIINGYRALWAGDFDSDGKIKFVNPNDDQNVLYFEVLFYEDNITNTANYNNAYGYILGDYNMNSKAKYTNPDDDKNLLFSQVLLYPLNLIFLSNFDYFIEQIPE